MLKLQPRSILQGVLLPLQLDGYKIAVRCRNAPTLERQISRPLCAVDEDQAERSNLESSTESTYGAPHSPEGNARDPPPLTSPTISGNAYLLAVSVLWGSYTPTLRALFTLPGGPTPFVVTAARGIIQAALLLTAFAVQGSVPAANSLAQREEEERSLENPIVDFQSLLVTPAILGTLEIGLYNTLGTLLQTYGLSVSVPGLADSSTIEEL